MPTHVRFLVFLLLTSASVVAALAADSGSARSRWHFEAGPSVWLGPKVQYGAVAIADPSPAARADRIYDNGFNRVDASGNLGDGSSGPLASRTGYFGFTSDSQVNLTAGTLALHRVQAAAGAYVSSRQPGTRPGVDLNLRYSLGSADAGKRDWGVELGYDYARLKTSSSGAEAAALRLLTDTYALGGVVPQRAPYAGRFSPLPGDQRIGDTPTRVITAVAGTATGTHTLSARTSVVRLGAWLDLFSNGNWSAHVHAGPALIATRASFGIDEQLGATGVPATVRVTESGSRRRQDVGAFAGVKARYSLNDHCALLAWGDYLRGGKLTVHGAGARFARLDLSQSFLLGGAIEVRWGKR